MIDLRKHRPLNRREHFSRLFQNGLGLCLFCLFGLGDALVIAVVVVGLGVHVGW